MFGLSLGGFLGWSVTIGGSFYLAYSLVVVVVGFLDDVWGGVGARGFGGHLGALWRGRVTMGVVKLVVFGGGAVVFALVVEDGVFAVGVGAVLLAGSVNLANLLDVRPGRAIKFVGVAVVGLVLVAPAGAVLAVAPIVGGMMALFYFDLKGRIMLGDAGAAVLGAICGYLALSVGPGLLWAVSLVVILGVTAIAEVSSISKMIERVGLLRRFDELGRG